MGADGSKLDGDLSSRGVQRMEAELKQRLGRGTDYNMKIVIRGDRSTGKSSLFARLQRKAFSTEYTATDSIQVATLAWDYKVTHDRIKVELWDVVDRATKGATAEADDGEPRLDASTVDVYRGAHAVIFLLDPRKRWTFEYVQRELEKVPQALHVLVLANFRDEDQSERQVSAQMLQDLADFGARPLSYIEVSMKNCFGLKAVRCFVNRPFLTLKRTMLEQQLAALAGEQALADEELSAVLSSNDYETYLRWLLTVQSDPTRDPSVVTVDPNVAPRMLTVSPTHPPSSAVSPPSGLRTSNPSVHSTTMSLSTTPTTAAGTTVPKSAPTPGSSTYSGPLKQAPAPPAVQNASNSGGWKLWPFGGSGKTAAPAKPAPKKRAPQSTGDPVKELQALASGPLASRDGSLASVSDFRPGADDDDGFWDTPADEEDVGSSSWAASSPMNMASTGGNGGPTNRLKPLQDVPPSSAASQDRLAADVLARSEPSISSSLRPVSPASSLASAHSSTATQGTAALAKSLEEDAFWGPDDDSADDAGLEDDGWGQPAAQRPSEPEPASYTSSSHMEYASFGASDEAEAEDRRGGRKSSHHHRHRDRDSNRGDPDRSERERHREPRSSRGGDHNRPSSRDHERSSGHRDKSSVEEGSRHSRRHHHHHDHHHDRHSSTRESTSSHAEFDEF